MKNRLKTLYIRLLLSEGLAKWREAINKLNVPQTTPPQADVFLAIDDPHSYLLIQVLPELNRIYNIRFNLHFVREKASDMFPEPTLWQQDAMIHCRYLASSYSLNFPDTAPVLNESELFSVIRLLCSFHNAKNQLERTLKVFEQLWQQLSPVSEITKHVRDNFHALAESEFDASHKLRSKLGHYQSGMLYMDGIWYWGIPRLYHFEHAMNERQGQSHQHYLKHRAQPVNFTKKPKITLYWSLRSPYSYLALCQLYPLVQANKIDLDILPVLPMVMRNLPVPKDKSMYILRDANREAIAQGIPFGHISDPVGKGVENCYSLFEFAKQHGKETDFLMACATAAWSQGIDLARLSSLKKICSELNLDWQQARLRLNDPSWREWAEQNQQQLYQHNQWGVPSLHCDGLTVFGQDRIGELLQHIQNKHPE